MRSVMALRTGLPFARQPWGRGSPVDTMPRSPGIPCIREAPRGVGSIPEDADRVQREQAIKAGSLLHANRDTLRAFDSPSCGEDRVEPSRCSDEHAGETVDLVPY